MCCFLASDVLSMGRQSCGDRGGGTTRNCGSADPAPSHAPLKIILPVGIPFPYPGCPQKSIVEILVPKTPPKWSPKWSQGNNGRSSRNMRRHERIACPPPLGSSVFAHFSYTGKRAPTSQHNHSDLRTWLQNDPQSVPPGSSNRA